MSVLQNAREANGPSLEDSVSQQSSIFCLVCQAAWDAFKGGDGERSITQAGTYASACKQV
jgi:hypothetical protein